MAYNLDLPVAPQRWTGVQNDGMRSNLIDLARKVSGYKISDYEVDALYDLNRAGSVSDWGDLFSQYTAQKTNPKDVKLPIVDVSAPGYTPQGKSSGMDMINAGLAGWDKDKSGKFLAENMQYLLGPTYQSATEGMYSRGLGRSTLTNKAYEPIQRAAVSGLGEQVQDLYFNDQSNQRAWQQLNLQQQIANWNREYQRRALNQADRQANRGIFG